MAILFLIIDGVRFIVSTLWDLQELRFAALFDDASSLTFTLLVTAVSCFIAMRS
ncbi:hypothetical protein ERO13_D13G042751v2 [Gossypium hirsutum]|uniref:Uncharacterized protein n=3 Tax=Gossypium TaxID=3633 RepID=A0A5J5NIA0_GOSBA|nr:hypothetical protein ES319_D13G050600v1 [Gossypium barbadense]KAG4110383.1 hypothetical protein ERO13_D13G042751v2 [Gossypium hirsutum]TYG36282.1 hypothetical protein ES288_D13G052800v1 [Gossypium darwinii]TYI45636.1 hypothetical protein E1A91_D13G051800v1 [Gossypium mustelinum]